MANKPKHKSGNHIAFDKAGASLKPTLEHDTSHMFEKGDAGRNVKAKWLHGKDGESKQAAIERLSGMGWNISKDMKGLKARKMGKQFRFELDVKPAEGTKNINDIAKTLSEGESNEVED